MTNPFVRLIIYFLLFICIFSCKKAQDRSCLKSTGKMGTKEISIPSCTKLELYENIEYVLIQDSLNKVVLIGGENLLNEISVTNSDETLTIKDMNNCNFLRSYSKKIIAEIHFKSISVVNYFGTKPLTNIGTLKLTEFSLNFNEGSGSVTLDINSDFVYANISNGYGDFTLTGSSNYANIKVNGNGYCNTYGLVVNDSISIVSNTVGSLKINADKLDLRAETKNGGNIYYLGAPSIKIFNKYGTGDLIKAN